MKQFMIAIDLDGTTLNNESKLTRLTIQTLRYLHRMGHLVVIATGRPYRNMVEFYRQLNINIPIITFNGAYCHMPKNPEWIPAYHNSVPKEIAEVLYNEQDYFDIDLMCIEGRDTLYASSMKLPDNHIYPVQREKLKKLDFSKLEEDPTAITLFTDESKQEEICSKIEDSFGDSVDVRTWAGFLPCLEIIKTGINKAVGLDRLSKFYHIPRENIIAFGDEHNDIEMLEYAGIGVAMANASEVAIKASNARTKYPNYEDGLARHLIEFFDLDINKVQEEK